MLASRIITILLMTALLAFTLKVMIFFIDHRALFFFGDSETDLYSATGAYTPIDRSFLYSDILQAAFALGAPLTAVVLINLIASTISAVLVTYWILLLAPSAPLFLIMAACTLAGSLRRQASLAPPILTPAPALAQPISTPAAFETHRRTTPVAIRLSTRMPQ